MVVTVAGGGGDQPPTLGGGEALLEGEKTCQQEQDHEDRWEVGSNLAPWATAGEHQILANAYQAVLDGAEIAGTVNLKAGFRNLIYQGPFSEDLVSSNLVWQNWFGGFRFLGQIEKI